MKPPTIDQDILQLACPTCRKVKGNREVMNAIGVILHQITINYLTTNVSEKQCLKLSQDLNELALKVVCPHHGDHERGCDVFPF